MKMIIRSVLVVACLLFGFSGFTHAQLAGDEDALEQAAFAISGTTNYKGARWLISDKTKAVVGYAPWDEIQRRFTLFDLKGRYYGFIQSTIGDTSNQYFTQYLWYDKNNRYKGIFIVTIGGQPTTPDNPYGELGGMMIPYKIGNIPPKYPKYEEYTGPLKNFEME
jgi:hypothetical protein